MDLSFFIRGLLIGLSIAATVGPMSFLCIQRTLNRGQLYGLVSGLGIATADGVYGSIAAFGLTLLTHFLVSEQIWIRLIGGSFLVYLGVRTVLTKPAERAAVLKTKTNGYLGAHASTFLLTLTNPLTIPTAVVIGVFTGSTLWWIILTSGINLLRKKITLLWLLWINRISGCIITLFGLLALLTLLNIAR